MVAQAIVLSIRNLPSAMLLLALILGAAGRPRGAAASRFLGWVLLLPTGVVELWAEIAHVAFPQVAAEHIGWQVSPFQFEVGMADLVVGITTCLAFWRPASSAQSRLRRLGNLAPGRQAFELRVRMLRVARSGPFRCV